MDERIYSVEFSESVAAAGGVGISQAKIFIPSREFYLKSLIWNVAFKKTVAGTNLPIETNIILSYNLGIEPTLTGLKALTSIVDNIIPVGNMWTNGIILNYYQPGQYKFYGKKLIFQSELDIVWNCINNDAALAYTYNVSVQLEIVIL